MYIKFIKKKFRCKLNIIYIDMDTNNEEKSHAHHDNGETKHQRTIHRINANKTRSEQRHGHGPTFAQRAMMDWRTDNYMTNFDPLYDRISRRTLGEQAGSQNPLLHSIRGVAHQRATNLGKDVNRITLGKRVTSFRKRCQSYNFRKTRGIKL